MLGIKEAKENLKKFRRDGQEIIPELTDDWIISFKSMFKSGHWVYVESKKLNIRIKLCNSTEFLAKRMMSGNCLKITPLNKSTGFIYEKYSLDGSYALSKEKLFIDSETFLLSEDLIGDC